MTFDTKPANGLGDALYLARYYAVTRQTLEAVADNGLEI